MVALLHHRTYFIYRGAIKWNVEMPNLSKQAGVAAILFGSLALAGCQSVGSYQPDIAWAGTKDAVVLMTAPEFQNTPSRHVVFTDIWQREEYALFQGGGAQAEIIYAASNERDTVALNSYLTVERMVNTWNIARNNTLTWGQSGQVGAPLGAYFYQRFRLGDTKRDCFGFITEWDQRPDDPYHRYTKTLFGYYCARPGAAIAKAEIAGLLDNVWIRGITARVDARFTPVAPSGPAASRTGATQFAQAGSKDTGNAAFPFNLAEYFNDADGQIERITGG
jgi:hypothetical protein